VAWGINNVDEVVIPRTGSCSRSNGDSALLLLLHPVHRGSAFMDFTDLVIDAGVEKDSLSCRGFTRVDMSHDPDVPDLGEINY
jgi:hypothetical protein